MSHSYGELCIAFVLHNRIRIRIRIFIIPINGPTIGANKLHTLIIVIGGNYTYIYNYNVSGRVQSLKKNNNINRKRKNISVS